MKVLFVSPHADDVEIGAGGAVARFVQEGHDVTLLTVIIPCEKLNGEADLDFKTKRLNEQKKAAKLLGAELQVLDFSPYEFTFDRVHCKIFDKIIRELSPNKIFSCWQHDVHQDHRSLSGIINVAARKNNFSLYMYENMIPGGISSESFNPQYYINITDFIDKKEASIRAYESVFGTNPEFCDAVLGRARYRGEQIGVKFAEAFEVIKEISL